MCERGTAFCSTAAGARRSCGSPQRPPGWEADPKSNFCYWAGRQAADSPFQNGPWVNALPPDLEAKLFTQLHELAAQVKAALAVLARLRL